MDLFLALIIVFFTSLIGGLLWYSHKQAAARAHTGSFLTDPTALVQLQLEELLEAKGVPKPHADPAMGSFEYTWKDKAAFDAVKSGNPAAIAETGAAGKSLQSALLARTMELARHMHSFDSRLAVIREAYSEQIPRDAVMYLNQISGAMRAEAEVIKTEAEAIKPGWGDVILRQAMDLTIGLERRKQMRAGAESAQAQAQIDAERKKIEDVQNKEREKVNKAKEEQAAKERAAKEADRAYRELMAGDKKGAGSQKKDSSSSSAKSGSQKKAD